MNPRAFHKATNMCLDVSIFIYEAQKKFETAVYTCIKNGQLVNCPYKILDKAV